MKFSKILFVLSAFGIFGILFSFSSLEGKEFHVALNGHDQGSGSAEDPFATLFKAQDAVREFKKKDLKEPVEVVVHEGIYYLSKRLIFTPNDSGTKEFPIIWRSAKGEKAILSGGFPITGWKKAGDHLYTASLSEKIGPEPFPREDGKGLSSDQLTQMFVNGRRAIPARTPNEGMYFYTRDLTAPAPALKCLGFYYQEKDAGKWIDDPNTQIVLYYNWSNSHNRILSVDKKKNYIEFKRPGGQYFLGPEIRYYITGSLSALDAPGEWFCDFAGKTVYYYPLPDEDLSQAQTIITRIDSPIVLINGSKKGDHPAEYLIFKDLCIEHSNANLGPDYPHSVQGAHTQFGALTAYGMEHVRIENCEFAHLGEHGISLLEGCRDNTVFQSHIHDLGGGGVYLSCGSPASSDPKSHTVNNTIENNIIHDGGYLYAAGCGIFLGGSASYNKLLHNEILDFSWDGIHAGWSWTGLVKAHTHHNEIAYNHIHHICNGVLNDAGGIYMLGVSSGTDVHHQRIHDVWRFTRGTEGYGGWGIYFDAGSSEIHVHENIVSDTQDGGLHLHFYSSPYGNIIDNNIFAFAKNGELMRNADMPSKKGLHAILSKNIIYENGSFVYCGENWNKGSLFQTDYNCFWTGDLNGPAFYRKSFADWQKEGNDQHSLLADPLFVDPDQRDFRLKPDSPALKLGFKPIDSSQIGVYGDAKWKDLAKSFPGRSIERAIAPPIISRYWDDFEDYKPGEKPKILTLYEENDKAIIRVSEEAGSAPDLNSSVNSQAGRRSLKVQDAPGQKYAHDPHVVYYKLFPEGNIHNSFDLKFQEGAPVNYEWRDWRGTPYQPGPHFTINQSGNLSVDGKILADLPADQWIHFDVRCKTGSQRNNIWSLKITIPHKQPLIFDHLPLGINFERLNYLGFISIGEKEKAFYIDNLLIELEDQTADGISRISSGLNYDVYSIQNGLIDFSEDLFDPSIKKDLRRLAPKGSAPGSYNSFLIYCGKRPVLIDACCQKKDGSLLKKILSLGLAPKEIAAVLLTHAHDDHVYGLLDSDDKAVFPAAEIYLCDLEKAHWEKFAGKNSMIRKVFKAYEGRIRTYKYGDTIFENIKCLDASGHAPGQTVFAVEDVCFTGDLIHAAQYQFSLPGACTIYDRDKPKTAAARFRCLNEIAKSGTLLFGAHVLFPGAGYLEKNGEGFRFIPFEKR
ncbi:MAG: right-handed parallel beta-helix repeat-containing protein [Planctomycetia bacterium]|nr:right-handed parallel beta-helix repeat-containing protein [Planctomycetia bacterium]